MITALADAIEGDLENPGSLESTNVGKPVSIIDFGVRPHRRQLPLLRGGSPLPGGTCGGEYLEDHTSVSCDATRSGS